MKVQFAHIDWKRLICASLFFLFSFSCFSLFAQVPGTTPVVVSQEKQMMHGRKYYVHIVEKGQTVYSIARAYRVESYDAVTHVDIHSLHPGDTVWLPFRGQFAEGEEMSTPKAAPTPAPTTPPVNTVYVHDTIYVNVPYAVHDTTYINVPYTVHDTIIKTDKVTQTEYVPVHDTTYIAVHDTTYINVPYAVHDTTVVTDKVKLTEYVPVHDTTYIAVHDTTLVIDTVTLTKNVLVRDTTFIAVHDTTYIKVPYAVHDATIVTDTVKLTEYVPVHDTTYINVPYTVHDTVIVTNTVTMTEYVPVHDTTYIKVPYAVHEATIVTDTVKLTEYVPVHDTTYIAVHDTILVIDTVTLTKSVLVRDTTYIAVHDTTYINVPYTVHDTTIVTNTVTLTEYVPVHDTAFIKVPYAVHDTTYIIDTVDFASASTDALAFAATSAVALTEYVPASHPATIPASPTTEQSQRQVGKTLKVALMMPLHLNQIDEISTSKFDVEQRGKKNYKQFEFIEFYEGILLALDQLSQQGIAVELNVIDVSDNTPAAVEKAFTSHNVAQSDMLVALLFRDCFDRAAQMAQQAGIYIVNPMATRSELCSENPYMVKIQPSLQGLIALMLNNMKYERPDGHLYIIHSNSKAEKAVMDELKRQLTERGDIKYTIFNWSQSARLASVLKTTPNCNVLSVYDQDKDNNRVFSINLLNRLSSIKKDSPTLYTLSDWTREYNDIDFAQLQLLNYHTYSLSWDMTNDVHVQFLQGFRSRFGSEPTSQLAATAYDLMLYIVNGLTKRGTAFWQSPGNSLPTLVQPLHLGRSGMGLENDKAQLYRLSDLRFIKAQFK